MNKLDEKNTHSFPVDFRIPICMVNIFVVYIYYNSAQSLRLLQCYYVVMQVIALSIKCINNTPNVQTSEKYIGITRKLVIYTPSIRDVFNQKSSCIANHLAN
jgi:hypothetical protein